MRNLELSEQSRKQINKLIGKFAQELRREFGFCELDVMTVAVRLSNEEGDSASIFASRHHQIKEEIEL